MRKPIVAGNWKMNKKLSESQEFFDSIEIPQSFQENVDIMVAPPAPYLAFLSAKNTTAIALGAQDLSAQIQEGAFTGEYSAEMLKSSGIDYAIIAHSERRKFHHETDEIAHEKIAACLEASVIPVYCCGETLEERDADNHISVVKSQVNTALKGFNEVEIESLVIAYEPVWAIGTGRTASAEQAQEMHHEIRNTLRTLFSDSLADKIRILYGGSVKPSNAQSIFGQPDVDGGLIGGASLKVDDFMAIVEAAG